MEMVIHMAILTVLGAVKTAVKNPAKSEILKEYLLETRDAINALYPDCAPASAETQAPPPDTIATPAQ